MKKTQRFIWRLSRNVACLLPMGKRMLFPTDQLAARFGRGDAEYAWAVFQHHLPGLKNAGFDKATRVLEVGPGRNLGTALLWWAYCTAQHRGPAEVVCWDVFPNTEPQAPGFWSGLARDLLDAAPNSADLDQQGLDLLQEIAADNRRPHIDYRVVDLATLADETIAKGLLFDFVYSQAAIEHIWHVDAFWETIVRLTRPGGWHSHRIDLADHGRRETNYIEMLEWSRQTYWLSMRFVPGAINRWRAGQHLSKLESLGLQILDAQREMRDQLPIPLSRISAEFRDIGEDELRTTALDIVLRKPLAQ